MSFIEIAKKRYSSRKYQNKKVEEDTIKKLLEAAYVAPTAANRQPQRLIVVREETSLQKIAKAANIHGAPLAIIICADKTEAWTRQYDQKQTTDIDATIITDHLMLQATDLGLGSVWICHFEPNILKKEFNIPDYVEPINILAIGYSDDQAASPDRHINVRKPLSETVSYESY